MTVLRMKKRRSYRRELNVEVYGGVKTVEAERCAEGVGGQEKEIAKHAENCKQRVLKKFHFFL